MNTLLFHSRSKKLINNNYGLPIDSGKLLSNFSSIPVTWRDHIYSTAEHAFQGAKYLYSSRPEIEQEFRILGSMKSPQQAKKAGSREGMNKRGAELDVKKWDEDSERIMMEIIASKIQDERIQKILEICQKNKINLVHFSNNDLKWGATIDSYGNLKKGENKLGKIYMQMYHVSKEVWKV
jgi:ribA/ribD-fused uncharacterized protein